MRKVILHIGRHKTGTTAIQRFLRKNTPLLDEHGIYYPDFGIRGFGHHELGAPVTRGALARSGPRQGQVLDELRRGLDAELRGHDSVVVISSESFQNCKPVTVRRLFEGYDVEVVVYLREQVKYLLSAYAQKIQATDYTGSLEDFYEQTSHTTYLEFLDEWESAFPSRIQVRNYDRQDMASANVVVDFCQSLLGLDGNRVASLCHDTDANPSLTQDLLEFKLRVNQGEPLPAEQSRLLFNALAKLAVEDGSGAMQISEELALKVAARYAESNRRVAQRYFQREALFRPFRFPRNNLMIEPLEERIVDIRRKLVLNSPGLERHLPDTSLSETR